MSVKYHTRGKTRRCKGWGWASCKNSCSLYL